MLSGGAYSLFAGRDATRALSKMQLTQTLFPEEYDDLADLTDGERATARNWHEDFRGRKNMIFKKTIFPFFFFSIEKYDIVGRLLKSGETASVYPPEESTVDGGGESNTMKKDE